MKVGKQRTRLLVLFDKMLPHFDFFRVAPYEILLAAFDIAKNLESRPD